LIYIFKEFGIFLAFFGYKYYNKKKKDVKIKNYNVLFYATGNSGKDGRCRIALL